MSPSCFDYGHLMQIIMHENFTIVERYVQIVRFYVLLFLFSLLIISVIKCAMWYIII